MLGTHTFEALRRLRFLSPHRRIQHVFFRMMHGIGIGRHVTHDVVNQFVIGPLAVLDAVNLAAEQVEHDGHVAVVFAKVVKQICQQNRHFSHAGYFCRALILRDQKPPRNP